MKVAAPTRSPERAALAAAIARRNAAEAKVAANNRALSKARQRVDDAEAKVDAALADVEKAKADELAAMLANKPDAGLVKAARKRLVDAETDAADAQEALASLSAALPDHGSDSNWALSSVLDAATAVIRSEVDLTALAAEARALQDRANAARHELIFLGDKGVFDWRPYGSGPKHDEATRVCSGLQAPSASYMHRSNMNEHHPVCIAWGRALAGLANDPDAKLPLREAGQ